MYRATLQFITYCFIRTLGVMRLYFKPKYILLRLNSFSSKRVYLIQFHEKPEKRNHCIFSAVGGSLCRQRRPRQRRWRRQRRRRVNFSPVVVRLRSLSQAVRVEKNKTVSDHFYRSFFFLKESVQQFPCIGQVEEIDLPVVGGPRLRLRRAQQKPWDGVYK